MARGADPPWSSHAGMPKTDIRKYVRHGFTWSHFTPGESYKRPVLWIFWHYTDILDNIDSPVPGFWSVCSQNLTVAICWSSFWEVDSTDSQGSICLATFAVKGSAVTIKAVHQFILWRNCLAFWSGEDWYQFAPYTTQVSERVRNWISKSLPFYPRSTYVGGLMYTCPGWPEQWIFPQPQMLVIHVAAPCVFLWRFGAAKSRTKGPDPVMTI